MDERFCTSRRVDLHLAYGGVDAVDLRLGAFQHTFSWMMAEFIQVENLRGYAWLRHGFSTRAGGVSTIYGGGSPGSLNLGWTKDDNPVLVRENRRRFWNCVTGRAGQPGITLQQMHGTEIHVLRTGHEPLETREGHATLAGDGLMTGLPGMLLSIQTADCVPVMLVDVEQRVVAVLHAGWRGTVAGIAEQGVACMQREYGSRVEDMAAAVGPSIGSCCYTIGDEVREAFFARFAYSTHLFHQDRLDLKEANRRQLVEAGIPQEHVAVVKECTGCARTPFGERKYFSHRIDQGFAGRMMSAIGVVEI